MSLRHTLSALVALTLALPASAQIVINEVDADQESTDAAEFVELYNAGSAAVDLSTTVLVFFNGSDDASYNAVDLDGFTLAADDYFVYCGDAANVPNCDLEVGAGTTNLIQNGADAVALFTGEASAFPTDTPASMTSLIDAVVYGTDDGDDTGLLTALGETTQYNDTTVGSIQRIPSGSETFFTAAPSPGEAGTEPARLQVIHNAPDPDAASVDVYVNGGRLLDNFMFRDATPFINVDAGVDLVVDIVPGTAADNSNPLFSATYNLPSGTVAQLIASGVLDDTPDNDADDTPDEFTLVASVTAQEAATDAGKVDVRAVHGSPDAPTVDIRAGSTVLFDNVSYPDVSDYLPVDPAMYTLDVTTADGATTVESFVADRSGAGGGAVTVLASGFLTPGTGEPAFGLLAVFPNGDEDLLPVFDPGPMAQLQVIHNSPDPDAATVDVYVNDDLFIDNLDFRKAEGYVSVPADVALKVDIVGGSAADNSNPVFTDSYTLDEDKAYQLIAIGVVEDGFEANPDEVTTDFTLLVRADLPTSEADTGVRLSVVHGSTDAPTVDVRTGDTVLFDDLTFGDAELSASAVPPAVYPLDVTTADGSVTAASFLADLSGAGGEVITVLASGFLTPANDKDGPAFGLLAVLADGTAFLLPQELSLADARARGVDTAVVVEGVVSRAAGAFAYLQDDTGGLSIRQTSGAFFDAVAGGTIAPGDTLRVVGELSEFRQLLQINEDDLDTFEVFGRGDAPMPQTVTLAELAAGGEDFEGELVTVRAVAIDGNGDTAFQSSTTYGVTDDSDATGAVSLRVPNADDTSVDGTAIPPQANITAVVGQFDFDDPAVGYQLLVIDAADVVNSVSTEGDAEAELSLAVANPIRLGADVRFTLDAPGEATVALYDALGRRVATLAEGEMGLGVQTARLDAGALASGVYVLRLEAESGAIVRTITVVR
ncbi:MAG: DUF4397 domain-containing protein [Bacteroidota bacterium]